MYLRPGAKPGTPPVAGASSSSKPPAAPSAAAPSPSTLLLFLLCVSGLFIVHLKIHQVGPLERQNLALQQQLDEVSTALLLQSSAAVPPPTDNNNKAELHRLRSKLARAEQALRDAPSSSSSDGDPQQQLAYDRKEAARTKLRLTEYARMLCELEPVQPPMVRLSTSEGDMLVRLAPCNLTPIVTMYIVHKLRHDKYWDGMTFFRAESHVIQATTRYLNGSYGPFDKWADAIPFPEYSSAFPHKRFTLGLAGRPGGTDFYVNMVDNVKNHGPGGQTYKGFPNSADACFGEIVEGQHVAERIQALPYNRDAGGMHILKQSVEIISMRLLGAEEVVDL